MTADGRPTTKGRRAGTGRSRSAQLRRRTLGVLGAMAALAAVAVPAGASAATVPHGLGLVPTPAPRLSGSLAGAMNAEQAVALPASVSLTADAMPVGNQGQVGSCAAWSTDYSALGYWENKENIAGGGLEPMYTYSQVDGGVDNGSTIEGNLQIDETQGIDTRADYWQGDFDYTDQPTAAERLNAVNWKLTGFSNLTIDPNATATVTQTSIETALAAGDPVVIGIPVYDNFFYVGTANNGYYASPSGGFAGNHAIAALGYNSQGLVIENSWGTGWGNAGYATLSWAFVNQYVFDAVSVGPLVATQPVNTAAPTVTGTPFAGQTLTASPGTWSASATYAYQWESAPSSSADWSTISGATSSKYVPTSAVQGDDLRVVVTATGASAVGSAASSATAPVGSPVPVNTAAPAVTGTPGVGKVLTASTGAWSNTPTAYAYQWQRSTNSGSTWGAITGATGSTYTTVVADAGAEVRVIVTATNSYGSAAANSAAAGPIAGAPVNTAAPAITGTLGVGKVLTASTGTWSNTPTAYTYQWQRSTNSGSTWGAITGATGSTYTTVVADAGAEVRVIVTATNSYGSAAANSAAAGPIAGAPVNTAAPAITGTLGVGKVLTASTGTWSNTPTAYTYQWQRSTNSGSTWGAITGATGSTYTTVVADAGAEVRVIVTATNSYGSAAANSAAAGPIAGAPVNTAAPAITGTLGVGKVLTASTGTWSNTPTAYTYQWQRSTNSGSTWGAITGATGSTYTTATADAGADVRVIVTATNSYGSAAANSAAAGPIPGTPINSTLPAITGTAARGSVLTASTGTWSPTPSKYADQWQRSTNGGALWTNIAGATSSTYTPATADEKAELRVVVTATNSYGSVTANSAATAAVSTSPPAASAAPVVTGTVAVGGKLTATAGTWSGVGNSYSYQWQWSAKGTVWTSIPSATGTTYTVASAYSGEYLRVLVTATNPDGSLGVASSATGKVAAVATKKAAAATSPAHAITGVTMKTPAKRKTPARASSGN